MINKMSLFVSSTLSVSRKDKLNCEEMAEFLKTLNIKSLITSNISLIPHKEWGCQLTQSITSKNDIYQIWEPLKNRYGFNCAHLTVGNSFNGCVLDYLAKTNCSDTSQDISSNFFPFF
jgi:hypothetical protein